MIFDSHAHYDDEAFNKDREELLNSMKKNKISYIVNVGASIDSSKRTLELTQQYDFIYGAIGVHPQEAAAMDQDKLEWIKQECGRDKIVAIGEIGLDYHWDEPAREIQKKWFEKQLLLAKEVNLPVIVHSRDAAKDTISMLQKVKAEEMQGVIHCYSYSKESAKEFMEFDFYYGIGGVITFQNAKKLKEVVEYLPLDHILIETDCPYLSPNPNRGKRNSSINLSYVVREIARIKDISEEEVMEQTCKNAKKMYRIKE